MEKRLLKLKNEIVVNKMSSSDTPSGMVERLQSHTKKQGVAGLSLSTKTSKKSSIITVGGISSGSIVDSVLQDGDFKERGSFNADVASPPVQQAVIEVVDMDKTMQNDSADKPRTKVAFSFGGKRKAGNNPDDSVDQLAKKKKSMWKPLEEI